MNEIEKLIQELCPDGVEYRRLGEVASIKTGKGITQKDCFEDAEYPVMSGGKTPMGRYTIFNRDSNTVTISRVGAYAGFVSFLEERFYCNDKCFSVIPKEDIELKPKYLFYVLKQKEELIKNLQSEGGVPTINTQKVGGIEIPLPPITIQEKIVEILDKFTSLEAELEAELEARRKQYEYYREKLLTFSPEDENVRWATLGEICENYDSKRRAITASKRTKGTFPYYGASGIVDYVEGYIFDGNYLLISEDGANLLARSTPIAFSINGKNWVNNHAHILKFKEIATQKMVEYYINMIDLTRYISGGAQPKLNQENLNRIPIPLPPLSEQRRIVAILDRFEALTNDLQAGLPAEIAARRQQYEYYREKLLTFKRKTV